MILFLLQAQKEFAGLFFPEADRIVLVSGGDWIHSKDMFDSNIDRLCTYDLVCP